MNENYFLLSLLDVTRLEDDKDDTSVLELIKKVQSCPVLVAAVCIYPRYLFLARPEIKSPCQLATVINFPHGNSEISQVETEIEFALKAGADELDVVFPCTDFFAGRFQEVKNFLSRVKRASKNATLKVILESGLPDYTQESLRLASLVSLECGADFLKTSTGKISIGATLPAATVLLKSIKEYDNSRGIKLSGGIRTSSQAVEYVKLASEVMGEDWVTSKHFRIGASSLFNELC